MIDLLYMLVAAPVCAALASISLCRLNNLDPLHSRATWIARYFVLGFIACGVGLEAVLHPAVFCSAGLKTLGRVVGLGICSVSLYAVLQTRWKWVGSSSEGKVDSAPVESNRSPLGEL